MLVRGVQSWQNDPQVEVLIAVSPDKPPVDSAQKIVGGGSLTMTEHSRHRTVMKGRILDGVLTTEPANLVLPRN